MQSAAAGSPAVSAGTPNPIAQHQLGLGAATMQAANTPSPATIFLQHGSQTPGAAFHAHLQQAVNQRGPPQGRATLSQAGSAVSSSLATNADAPNEARKVIRMLLENEGQGRLSLTRIQAEFQVLIGDIMTAFASNPSYDVAERIEDLLATLDELQVQLARTGLGALKAVQTDFSNPQAAFGHLANSVQSDFRARQRIRDGAGVARSVLK